MAGGRCAMRPAVNDAPPAGSGSCTRTLSPRVVPSEAQRRSGCAGPRLRGRRLRGRRRSLQRPQHCPRRRSLQGGAGFVGGSPLHSVIFIILRGLHARSGGSRGSCRQVQTATAICVEDVGPWMEHSVTEQRHISSRGAALCGERRMGSWQRGALLTPKAANI